MEENDDRVRVRVEYVLLSGPESYHNYPMLWSNREQGFFVLAGAPSRSRFAVDVYVRGEYRYSREVESVIRTHEGDFDVSVLDTYYPQERLPGWSGGDVPNQYPTKVKEYERTNTATLDGLLGGYHVNNLATEASYPSRDKGAHHHPGTSGPVPQDETIFLNIPVGPRGPILGIIIRGKVLE